MLVSMCSIGKMIIAPAVTARYAEESLWIAALINFAVDGIFVFFILKMKDYFGDMSFYEILTEAFGELFAKAIYFVFFIYFIFRAYVPLMEQKNYIEVALYETAPSVLTFLIFFLFSAFICYKGVKSVARCADMTVWIASIGIIALFALSVSLSDPTNLMPIFGVPATRILEASKNTSVWYLDGAYILFLCGNYKREKLYKTKILSAYGIMAITVTVYMIMLYGEYGPLTLRQYFSPIQIGKGNVALSSIGRIDYISGFIFAFVSAFTIALPLIFASEALTKVFNFENKLIPSLIVNGASLAAILFTHDSFLDIYDFLSKTAIWGYFAAAYILPSILLLIARRRIVK